MKEKIALFIILGGCIGITIFALTYDNKGPEVTKTKFHKLETVKYDDDEIETYKIQKTRIPVKNVKLDYPQKRTYKKKNVDEIYHWIDENGIKHFSNTTTRRE